MNDDESEARVVFARVLETDGSGCMQRLADRCLELAVRTGQLAVCMCVYMCVLETDGSTPVLSPRPVPPSGLCKTEQDRVKLHCTSVPPSLPCAALRSV